MRLKFKPEVSVGEILTSLSILISLAGVLFSWHQDRKIEIARQSKQLREVSIQAFSNILTWEDLHLYFYDKAEVTIKDASKFFDKERNNIAVRDYFSQSISDLKNEIEYEIMQKNLKTFHFTLLSNGLDADSTFLRTVTLIAILLEQQHRDYLKDTQSLILTEKIQNAAQTAILGNKLREVNNRYRRSTQDIFRKETRTIEVYLKKLITKSDFDTVYPNRDQ